MAEERKCIKCDRPLYESETGWCKQCWDYYFELNSYEENELEEENE